MKIKDRPEFLSKPKPITFRETQMVSEAVAIMAERNIGSVIITGDSGSVDGIMTERDLLRRLLANGLNPSTTAIGTIMTREVKVAHLDDEVIDWMRQMSNDRFRHLPVVDDNGMPIKMMSQGDFVSYTWPLLLMLRAGETVKRAMFSTWQINALIALLVLYIAFVTAILAFR